MTDKDFNYIADLKERIKECSKNVNQLNDMILRLQQIPHVEEDGFAIKINEQYMCTPTAILTKDEVIKLIATIRDAHFAELEKLENEYENIEVNFGGGSNEHSN